MNSPFPTANFCPCNGPNEKISLAPAFNGAVIDSVLTGETNVAVFRNPGFVALVSIAAIADCQAGGKTWAGLRPGWRPDNGVEKVGLRLLTKRIRPARPAARIRKITAMIIAAFQPVTSKSCVRADAGQASESAQNAITAIADRENLRFLIMPPPNFVSDLCRTIQNELSTGPLLSPHAEKRPGEDQAARIFRRLNPRSPR